MVQKIRQMPGVDFWIKGASYCDVAAVGPATSWSHGIIWPASADYRTFSIQPAIRLVRKR